MTTLERFFWLPLRLMQAPRRSMDGLRTRRLLRQVRRIEARRDVRLYSLLEAIRACEAGRVDTRVVHTLYRIFCEIAESPRSRAGVVDEAIERIEREADIARYYLYDPDPEGDGSVPGVD